MSNVMESQQDSRRPKWSVSIRTLWVALSFAAVMIYIWLMTVQESDLAAFVEDGERDSSDKLTTAVITRIDLEVPETRPTEEWWRSDPPKKLGKSKLMAAEALSEVVGNLTMTNKGDEQLPLALADTSEKPVPHESMADGELRGSPAPQLFYKPRLLVGIVSDSQTISAKILRNRHRQLFQLWNDTRLCSLQTFVARQAELDSFHVSDRDIAGLVSYDCQIVYSFILGAYSKNTSSPFFADDISGIPTIRLTEAAEQPLELDSIPLPMGMTTDFRNTTNIPPYSDVLDHGDGTFLNIVESMKNGKSPTFMFWASKISKELNIPFVAKCDSDSFMNLDGLLQFLHQDLPKIPIENVGTPSHKQPSVLAGSPMLRKELKPSWFLRSTNESYWESEHFMGSHLYYNGGFYLMTKDLTESATRAARKLIDVFPRIIAHSIRRKNNVPLYEEKPHAFLEGNEDHDTIATAEVGHYDFDPEADGKIHWMLRPSIIQWFFIPQYSRFHVHPAKTSREWGPLWKKEVQLYKAKVATNLGKEPKGLNVSAEKMLETYSKKTSTLMVVYGSSTHEERENYRETLLSQGMTACNGLKPQSSYYEDSTVWCDIHYFFVVGTNDRSGGIPTENISNLSTLVFSDGKTNSQSGSVSEEDVVLLNIIGGTNSEGLGLSILFYIQEQIQSGNEADSFDLIMFCKTSHMINIQQWMERVVSTAQYSVMKKQQKHLLIGDVRDKGRKKREFRDPDCPDPLQLFKYHKSHAPHWIQLYLGSDCFAFAANVIPLWLEKARDPNIERCTEGHLGHDLTYFSYTTGATLQWMRIPNSLQFWYPFQ